MKIALCVNHDKYLKDGMFSEDRYVESHLREFYRLLKEAVEDKGDEIHTLDLYEDLAQPDVFLFFDYPLFNPLEYSAVKWKNYRQMRKVLQGTGRKILYIWESPLYNKGNFNPENYRQFDKVLCYSPLEIPNYEYFPYSIRRTDVSRCRVISRQEFDSRKLSCMITSNKLIQGNGYDLRYEIVDYFENRPDGFDLYGVNWIFEGISKAARVILRKKYAARPPKNYKGSCDSKQDTFEHYRFGFAIENLYGFPGYVSEKLFDVLTADCVPVYTGSNIMEGTIPKDIFVDIEAFASLKQLDDYLRAMSYEEYAGFLERKIEFLHSPQFADYFHQANVGRMMDVIYGKNEG